LLELHDLLDNDLPKSNDDPDLYVEASEGALVEAAEGDVIPSL